MIHGADPWWDAAIRLMLKYRNLRLDDVGVVTEATARLVAALHVDARQGPRALCLRLPRAVVRAVPWRSRKSRSGRRRSAALAVRQHRHVLLRRVHDGRARGRSRRARRAVAVRFYTEVMGFALVDRREFGVGTVCKLRRGAARLKIFFPRDAVDSGHDRRAVVPAGRWRYAALKVEQLDDVDALAAAADAAQGRVLIAPTATARGPHRDDRRPRGQRVGAARRRGRRKGRSP